MISVTPVVLVEFNAILFANYKKLVPSEKVEEFLPHNNVPGMRIDQGVHCL